MTFTPPIDLPSDLKCRIEFDAFDPEEDDPIEVQGVGAYGSPSEAFHELCKVACYALVGGLRGHVMLWGDWPRRSVMLAELWFMSEEICRVCGCGEMDACETPEGPCHWVEPDLCSACAPAVRWK